MKKNEFELESNIKMLIGKHIPGVDYDKIRCFKRNPFKSDLIYVISVRSAKLTLYFREVELPEDLDYKKMKINFNKVYFWDEMDEADNDVRMKGFEELFSKYFTPDINGFEKILSFYNSFKQLINLYYARVPDTKFLAGLKNKINTEYRNTAGFSFDYGTYLGKSAVLTVYKDFEKASSIFATEMELSGVTHRNCKISVITPKDAHASTFKNPEELQKKLIDEIFHLAPESENSEEFLYKLSKWFVEEIAFKTLNF